VRALQYKTALNWSTYEDKLRVEFGSYLFTATNEGDSPAYAIATAADLSNLAAADITGNNQIGGIAGYNKGTVSDCHVAADVFIRAVQSNVNHHGGIVGQNDGTVSNCTSAATLTNNGGIYYGGIAGYNIGTLSHNLAIGAVVPTLRDDADNSTALGLLARLATAGPNGTPLDLGWGAGKYPMQLTGRKLWKDGAWNTLCLPFDLGDPDASKDHWFDGTPLEGATVMTLDGTESRLDLNIDTDDNGTPDQGWYYVGLDIAYDHPLVLGKGNVNIVLGDGYTMNIDYSDTQGATGYGIFPSDKSALTIYGQTLDDATAGNLDVNLTASKGFGIYVFDSYSQHSGNVNVTTQGPCQGIVAKGVLFDGGTLRVSADDAEAICSQTNIAILGGKLDATTTEDRHDGLYSFGGGTITLGRTRPDDYIHASRYLTNGDVKIANGQAFYYTFGNARTVLGPTNGALTADLIAYISGQTLQPICLLTESDGVTALTTAPWNSVADAPVAFIRNDNMGDLFSTVCLPFDFTAPEGCTFYVFQRVLYDENLRGEGKGAWVADFAEVSQMMAHTPYIFRNTAKKAVFTGNANTETDYDDALTSNVFSAQDANDETWTFKGTYSAIDWSDADPSQPTYSMAYDQGIRSYYIGAFERIGQGASLAPFRACLTYSGNGNLPEEILVRFGNSHGDFTAIEGVLAE